MVGGPGSYARFLEWSATPWVLTLNVVSFLFIVFHAITFFNAAPQAMVVHIGARAGARHPGHWRAITWRGRAASVFVAWLLLGA